MSQASWRLGVVAPSGCCAFRLPGPGLFGAAQSHASISGHGQGLGGRRTLRTPVPCRNGLVHKDTSACITASSIQHFQHSPVDRREPNSKRRAAKHPRVRAKHPRVRAKHPRVRSRAQLVRYSPSRSRPLPQLTALTAQSPASSWSQTPSGRCADSPPPAAPWRTARGQAAPLAKRWPSPTPPASPPG